MITAGGALTAAQARDYYKNEYSRGDYYSEGETIQGEWMGAGAEATRVDRCRSLRITTDC